MGGISALELRQIRDAVGAGDGDAVGDGDEDVSATDSRGKGKLCRARKLPLHLRIYIYIFCCRPAEGGCAIKGCKMQVIAMSLGVSVCQLLCCGTKRGFRGEWGWRGVSSNDVPARCAAA